jgi:hypothetical protein
LRVEVDADVDPREHLHDREADLFVVDVAVVRAVHVNVEAVLIAGVTQQLARALGIMARPLDVADAG